MVVLGQQWRWDTAAWRDSPVNQFFDTGLKANLVTRTVGDTTSVSEGLAALAVGNRSGKAAGNWNLAAQLTADSLGAITFNTFGSKVSTWFRNEKSRPGHSGSDLYYPDAYFQNADPGVFATLLGTALRPGSVSFVDTTVVPREKQFSMVAALLEQARDQGWNLMAISVSDAPGVGGEPRLQAFLGFGSYFGSGAATSASTRRPGLVQLADVSATILDYFGAVIPPQVKGQPIGAKQNVSVRTLASAARRAAIILPAQRCFIPLLSTLLSIVLIAGVWSLNRRLHPNLGSTWESPRRLLRFWRGMGLFLALVPAASFLMNLVPWWEVGSSETEVAVGEFYWFGALLPFAVAGIISIFWSGLGLNALFGPLAIISVSSLVIGLFDPWIGSPMMLDAVMGAQSTIGGRFYGIDNMMFAIYLTGALLLCSLIYGLAGENTRRPLFAVLLLFAVGVMAIDAIPFLGADFGGLLAAFPAFVVLFVKLRSKPLKPLLSLVVLLFAFGLAALLAYLDWLRPPSQRTHLGHFVDSVRDGKLGEILWGKLTQLSTAGWNPVVVGLTTAIFFVGIALLAWPLFSNWRNPYRRDYAWLLGSARAQTAPEGIPLSAPEKAFIWAWFTAMMLGMALNDSTVLVGLVGFTVAAPAWLSLFAHKYLEAK